MIDAQCRARLDAAGEVLAELGVVGREEVRDVRARLEDAIPTRRAVARVDKGLARGARGLLDRRLAEVRLNPDLPRAPALLDDFTDSDPAHGDAVTRFELACEACAASGALTVDELAGWEERLLEVDDGRMWSVERRRRQKRFTMADLRAVVPGDPHPDGCLRVTTAELYADGVVLRWHERERSRGQLRPLTDEDRRRRRVSLSDDLGTEYLHLATNEAITAGAVLWTAQFVTAVPVGARLLVANIRDERVTLRLPSQVGGE
ncbi:MAG: hypothetical protein M3071_24605 [Actinomycetota bacterium]|nr:hypothetical protein [Actinomycetota bacterium]